LSCCATISNDADLISIHILLLYRKDSDNSPYYLQVVSKSTIAVLIFIHT